MKTKDKLTMDLFPDSPNSVNFDAKNAPEVRVFGNVQILEIVKNGKLGDAARHVENVRRLLSSGDKTYAEYIPHLASIDKQLRQKSRVIALDDGNFLSKQDAWAIRRFFRQWEQMRRDYVHIISVWEKRISKPLADDESGGQFPF